MSIRHELLDKVRNYHLPERAVEVLSRQKPLIIASVTAGGKNSVVKHIEASGRYKHTVTHTTRKPRAEEHSGENYWFVSDEEMLKLLEAQELIEANAVHGDTVYGTSIASYELVVHSGFEPVLIIDVQGVRDITKRLPQLSAAFLLPPSFDIWMERLNKRGHMSEVERHQRLRSAQKEIEEVLRNRHFILVVNHEVSRTAVEVVNGATDQLTQHKNRELAEKLLDHIRHY